MPGWYDDDDDWLDEEELFFLTRHIRFDEETQRWVCPCLTFQRLGRCTHVVVFRRQITIYALEKYL